MNRLNIITLGVKDVTKSLSFYKALGFETHLNENDQPPIVFFDNEGTKLALYNREELLKDTTLSSHANEGFKGFTLAYNTKNKTEVDTIIKRAEKAGATIIKLPTVTDWGGYSGYFIDLDGYTIEVAYGDMWAFDDNNMLIIRRR